MNIAEKKRAEEMIHDAFKSSAPTKSEIEVKPSAELLAAQKAFKEALKRDHFHVGYGGGLTADSDHPDYVKATKEVEAARRALQKRERDLVASVWNGDHTFESLRAELAR